MTVETWRVVVAGGAVRTPGVAWSDDGPWAVWTAVTDDPSDDLRGHGRTTRLAVLALAHLACWDVREILAPGELSAEERVAAERARCAAVCREVYRRYYCDRVSRSEGATECAEAIERGEVGDG